eukprot:scaffold135258_cov93-Cyclotella_meneghiniana.AAC.2
MFAAEPSLPTVTLPPPDPAPPHRPMRIPPVSPRRALQYTLGALLAAPANANLSSGHLPALCSSRMLTQLLLLLVGSLFILHEWRRQFQKVSASFSGITLDGLCVGALCGYGVLWLLSEIHQTLGHTESRFWIWCLGTCGLSLLWIFFRGGIGLFLGCTRSVFQHCLVQRRGVIVSCTPCLYSGALLSWLPILLLGCFTNRNRLVATSPEPRLHAPPWPSISADYIVDPGTQWFTLPEGADPACDFDRALISADCPFTSAFDSLLDDYVFSIQSLSPSLFSLTEAGYEFSVTVTTTEFVSTGNWRSKRSALRQWIKRQLPARTPPCSPMPSSTPGCPSVHPSAVAHFGSFCHHRPDVILHLWHLFDRALSWATTITSDDGASCVTSPIMSCRQSAMLAFL